MTAVTSESVILLYDEWMTALVIYDSLYGNTEKIANAIAKGLGGSTKIKPVAKTSLTDLAKIDLLVVGSPTHGGRPTPALQAFLNTIPSSGLAKSNFATFDTRFDSQKQRITLKLLMTVIDYAAPKIAKTLLAKGGRQVLPPQGFIVTGKDGPLKPKELTRATTWGKSLSSH